LPRLHDLDLAGLDIDHKSVAELLGIDHEEWQRELDAHETFFQSLGGVVPQDLLRQREDLAARFKE
jgi:GTP-dependent phosphoenolpyruvate carboxykinase